MQLFEFFMWSDIKDHSLVSKLAYIFIHLQPFVLATSLYYFSLDKKKKEDYYTLTEKAILGGIAVLSFIKALAGGYFAFITKSAEKWLSVKGPNCHLEWRFISRINELPGLIKLDQAWLLTLFCSLLMIKPFSQGFVYFSLSAISAFLTKLFFPTEVGSLWCWMVNLIGVIAIAMPYIMSYITPLKI